MTHYLSAMAGRIRAAARALAGSRADPPRSPQGIQTLINGYQHTALICLAARLRLADHLGNGPRTSAQLAQALGAHAPSLHRVLRGLVTLGVCSEAPDGRFALTALGAELRSDSPAAARGLALLTGEEYAPAWGNLLYTVMTGEPAFRHCFGMNTLEHRAKHPELNDHFNKGLALGAARVAPAILAAYDFSAFRSVTDVGGGQGALLAALLQAHPHLNATLFERPPVAAAARAQFQAAGVSERCRVVEGDFFDHLPGGADALILKSVLHDWDDERAAALLRNCRQALSAQGRLLIIERLLPERAADDPAAIVVDLQMLALTGGRERSEADHRALLNASGFALARVLRTAAGFSILEAART
ncbi:MAG: methyltransferase [Candidatus Brocadiia bacterium]|jgi:SAM-dependent methyltransferase